MDTRTIRVINFENICEYHEKEITEEIAGLKATGLLRIPNVWRLPFFVIHSNVAVHYIESTPAERKTLISVISSRVRDCVKQLNFKATHIIIRSSGKEEGMNERGKYNSENCLLADVEKTLKKLFDASKEDEYDFIAYIVQPFVARKKYGHLSNERRVAKDARDWMLEFEDSKSDVDSFGIRSWRSTFKIEEISKAALSCSREEEIKSVLRKVAYFYTVKEKKQRIHLEFVWDGEHIFIVQNDIEQYSSIAVNPWKQTKMNNPKELERLNVFHTVDKAIPSEFSKIENVRKYAQLGLPTAPFYMLRDRKIIEELSFGKVSNKLQEDICRLVSYSIVVRTDVSRYENADKQLLPRSNELRTFEAFMEWSKTRLPELLKYNDIILLVHVFIPAVSAAFAYASPDNRIVTIHSLWGLPEGLYYNTHDTTQVDTETRYMEHVDPTKIKSIKKRKNYKAFFYAPDSSGKWKEMMPMPPFDWQISISKKHATYIAWASRLIAQNENKTLSIMWFVEVNQSYYQTKCLPWYHEEVSEDTFVHDVYQKKYYTQFEKRISSKDDLNNIANPHKVGSITIHPQDDSVLRDKDFLKTVGEFAKQHNIAIFLEGTVLAHPVYRLMSQGVKVVLTDSERMLFGWEQFNKLVRDKIPDKIQNNMEGIKCYIAKEGYLLRYLKEKLIEEAYEVLDAKLPKEILEELSDVYEVINAIRNFVENDSYPNIGRSGKSFIKENLTLLHNIKVENLSEKTITAKYISKYFLKFCLERSHQELELELRFLKKQQDIDLKQNTGSPPLPRLLYLVYQLLDACENSKICHLCDDIITQINSECRKLNETLNHVVEISEKKRKKNGGFQKGYVLKETSKNSSKKSPNLLNYWETETKKDSLYAELNELLFNPVTYVDYRKTTQEELLIRIKYPLCFENQNNQFAGKAINNMFGIDSKIYITADRDCEKYAFSIYLGEKSYQQLILDLN